MVGGSNPSRVDVFHFVFILSWEIIYKLTEQADGPVYYKVHATVFNNQNYSLLQKFDDIQESLKKWWQTQLVPAFAAK